MKYNSNPDFININNTKPDVKSIPDIEYNL